MNAITVATSDTDMYRRGSLLALAGALLAPVIGTSQARASKKDNKARKRDKNRADKLCRRQVDSCRAAYDDMCGESARPQCFELRDAIFECCDHLADCQAGETFTCISAAFTEYNQRRLRLLPR
jgi:hypothetical protein